MKRTMLALFLASALAACAHDRGFDRPSARAIENDTPAISAMPQSAPGDQFSQDRLQPGGPDDAN